MTGTSPPALPEKNQPAPGRHNFTALHHFKQSPKKKRRQTVPTTRGCTRLLPVQLAKQASQHELPSSENEKSTYSFCPLVANQPVSVGFCSVNATPFLGAPRVSFPFSRRVDVCSKASLQVPLHQYGTAHRQLAKPTQRSFSTTAG